MSYIVFPVIVPNQSPVTASTGLPNLTYDQLVQSFNDFYVNIDKLYIQGGDYSDISKAFYYQKYSQSGTQEVFPTKIEINPSLSQPAFLWDTEDKSWVINNLSDIKLDMNPFGQLDMVFFCKYGSTLDDMQGASDNKPKAADIKYQQPLSIISTKEQSSIGLKLAAIVAGLTIVGIAVFSGSKITK